MTLQTGLVVTTHGRHCMVELASGQQIICHPRGKKNLPLVGDRVQWLASQDEGTIEKIEPRRNCFYRQDEVRTKAFAANLDQVLVLVAAEPEFSESQLTRSLIAAEAEGITPVIVLNKSDLPVPFARAMARLTPYRVMGYPVHGLSVRSQPDVALAELTQLLAGKTTLLLGPSGSGKSSLTNLLVPQAKAYTQEISSALNSGKHTTTSSRWYWVDSAKTTSLIDSPGFQEFGLQHIEAMQLAACMPDFAALVPQCKFYNCTHLHEPGCGVISQLNIASNQGSISASRYRIYTELFAELSQRRY